MASMSEIEQRALDYAKARAAVGARAEILDRMIRKVQAVRLPMLRKLIQRQIELEAALRAAIASAPHLFQRPRTVIAHGIRFGFTKGKGRLDWDDADAVVRRIRRHLPDQADVLIRVREEPVKAALMELPAADLKKLGVRLSDAEDQIVIRPVDSEIDKLLARLLAGTEAAEPKTEQKEAANVAA